MFEKKILQTVLSKIKDCSFKVTYWDGESEVYNAEHEQDLKFHLKINEKLNLKEIRQNPQLRLGEAYIQGKIDVEGKLKKVLEAGIKNINHLKNEDFNNEDTKKFWQRQEKSSQKEQEEGVKEHYDLGNDFFELWQDETMTYSCAYFQSYQDSLKQAQIQKIDHILNKLNLSPGEKILDIGCGWGSLAIRAAEKYDVEVVGITLSEEQVKGASQKISQKKLDNQIEIRKQDFRDLSRTENKFDKVVSVGMFEHVGKEHIPEYFQVVNDLLKPGGLSLLHTITHLKEIPTHPWLEKYIFPWGYIPSLREIIWELPEYSFQVLDVENIGLHYSLTAEHWKENYEKVTDQVREKFDQEFVRMWRLFLAGVIVTFRYGNTDVHQILFSKGINNELPLTRDYMYAENNQ
ncbi:MAG: class I SAM-dependent methyltransferase [Bacillota bacterium]